MHDFDQCVVEVIPRLRRYALSLTRNASLADDLVQETLLRALSRRHLFVPGTNLRAWLFTILHNLYVNVIRRSARAGTNIDIDDAAEMLTTRTYERAGLELKETQEALATLPKEQQQAIILVGVEGLSYDQAAHVSVVPVGTVRSRLSRGRAALNRIINPNPSPGGRPRDLRLRQEYERATIRLKDKGLVLSRPNIADELKKGREGVKSFTGRNVKFSKAS